MFKAMLTVQWKWSRGAVLLATLCGFAIPLASVQVMDEDAMDVAYLVARMQGFGIGYALLAGGIGVIFALLAWSSDHKGRHVYALSLPVGRARYAAMRFGAGALFLSLPALGVFSGSLLAVMVATIPPGLHAYPLSLAFRFLLASTVAFSMFFAVAASTSKAAGVVLGVIASGLIVAFIFSAASINYDVLGRAADLLFNEPGPLSVFTGRWMLIDA